MLDGLRRKSREKGKSLIKLNYELFTKVATFSMFILVETDYVVNLYREIIFQAKTICKLITKQGPPFFVL